MVFIFLLIIQDESPGWDYVCAYKSETLEAASESFVLFEEVAS